jgi:hypothetical protein
MKATNDSGMDAFRQRMRARLAELGQPHGVGAGEIFHLMDRL